MNFFAQQQKARRNTALLAAYFFAAVVLIVLAINAGVLLAVMYSVQPVTAREWLQKPYWIYISLATLLVIFLGSMVELYRLRGGGVALAKMIGARRIDPATRDPDERRLINVVEEISIASGTPVPRVYVLDSEWGINAFVAGFRPTETVLVVTRGALQNFTRSELQGVIGHEYSHIFNGDMRINVRLMGILAGIFLIGQIGGFLLRSQRHTRRSRGKGGGGGFILLLGLVLFLVGYIGLFFGRLIKAAVSRQREFLADASSVQYTRHPDGIAGALWKISQHAEGSLLQNRHAEDMSHMCFGQGLKFHLKGLFDTHPPLEARIRAIDAGFISRAKAQARREKEAAKTGETPAARFAGGVPALAPAIAVSGEQVAASVGNPAAAHFEYAAGAHAGTSLALLDAAHEPAGARAVIYLLLLAGTDPARREALIERLGRRETGDVLDTVTRLAPEADSFHPGNRLVLTNIAIPSLKSLSADETEHFLECIEELVQADERYTLMEFSLVTVLREHLAAGAEKPDSVHYYRFDAVREEIRAVISALAHAGAPAGQAERTFAWVMKTLVRSDATPPATGTLSLDRLRDSLIKLSRLAPMLKSSLIQACADCVIHDGKVEPAEAELLQAVALSLDCPMPPLLATE